MKKILVCIVLVLAFICPLCVCGETTHNVVAEMPYKVKMPDVTRLGLYTGEVTDSIPDGYGVFVATNSQGVEWHYLGQWKNGEMCGNGGQYWNSGLVEVGLYESNILMVGISHPIAVYSYTIDRRPDTLQSLK